MNRRRSIPSNGRLLQLVALAHTAVGIVFYRRELRSIARDGIVGGVPYRGPKATAFWFLVPSPLIWLDGMLVRRAEAAGDLSTLRSANGIGLVSAAIAVICMPISGFWGWLAISVRGLWQAQQTGG
jgi:hypothetical protein